MITTLAILTLGLQMRIGMTQEFLPEMISTGNVFKAASECCKQVEFSASGWPTQTLEINSTNQLLAIASPNYYSIPSWLCFEKVAKIIPPGFAWRATQCGQDSDSPFIEQIEYDDSKCLEDAKVGSWNNFFIEIEFVPKFVCLADGAGSNSSPPSTQEACHACKRVVTGGLAGVYELNGENDSRCDDGCSYVNEDSIEFCFKEGGETTELGC